jgi:hypothetical protein
MNRNLFDPYHHPLSGNVIHDEFDASLMIEITLPARFLGFVLMRFRRHFQQGDKQWLIFDSLHIVCEILTQKAIYVILKLLPFLV